jgi:hypothetical protein
MAGVFTLGGLVTSSVDAFGVYIILVGLVYAGWLVVKILRLP